MKEVQNIHEPTSHASPLDRTTEQMFTFISFHDCHVSILISWVFEWCFTWFQRLRIYWTLWKSITGSFSSYISSEHDGLLFIGEKLVHIFISSCLQMYL